MLHKDRTCIVHHKNSFVNDDKIEFVVMADHLGYKSRIIIAAEFTF